MFGKTKPPMATSAKGAVSFLSGQPEKAPNNPTTDAAAKTGPPGQDAESSAYKEVKALVDKYGMQAMRDALDQCDEATEGTATDDDTDSAADLEPVSDKDM